MVYVRIFASVACHQHHIFGIDLDGTAEVCCAIAGGQHQAVLVQLPCAIHIKISLAFIAKGHEFAIFENSNSFFVCFAFRTPNTNYGLAVVHIIEFVVTILRTAVQATHCHKGNDHKF